MDPPHPSAPFLGAWLALSALVVAASSASAQAWLRWDQSAAAAGRGGAAAAVAEDASAVFHNPAGIASLFGTHVRMDLATTLHGGEFHAFGAGSFDRDADLDFEGGVYVTHTVARDVTLGLAINTPWGLSVSWDRPARFVGRFRATETSLRSIAVSPVLAWQAAPDLALAGGPVLTYGVLEFERFEQDPDLSALGGAGPIALARSRYELDGLAVGWVLGASWRIDDALSAGAHVRNGIDLDLVGPVDFEGTAPAELRDFLLPGREITIGEILDARFVDQEAGARLPLPLLASAGVAWSPIERVRLTADLQWLDWDRAESLFLDFVDDSLDDRQRLGYDDAWAFRSGIEIRHRPGQVVRLGFAHEASPAPGGASGPLVPDADRDAISAGAGFLWRDLAIDLAYRIAFLSDRQGVAFPGNRSPDGIYEATEHRLMVGVGRRF